MHSNRGVRFECTAQITQDLPESPKIPSYPLMPHGGPCRSTRAENTKCPIQMAREYNLNFMHKYAKYYVSTQRIETLKPMVSEIMKTGIKRANATHIACAIDAECNYLITVDDRMLKYKDDRTKVISPNDMLYIMEDLK